jgi:hypothetical protein
VVDNVGLEPMANTGVIVTVAVALIVGFATLVAVTVALVWAETVGAMKSPVLEIVPRFADQVTCCWAELFTIAANLSFEPEGTVATMGETETLMVNALAGDATQAADIRTAVQNNTRRKRTRQTRV